MRRRDKHFLVVNVVLAGLCIGTSVFSAFVSIKWVRRWEDDLAVFSKRLDSVEENARAYERPVGGHGAGVASSASGASELSDDTLSPVLLGLGQTKSVKNRYIYADYRMADGTTERKYIKTVPLQD